MPNTSLICSTVSVCTMHGQNHVLRGSPECKHIGLPTPFPGLMSQNANKHGFSFPVCFVLNITKQTHTHTHTHTN